jgi:TnpA family transposase
MKSTARKTGVFLAIGGSMQYTQEQLINIAKFSSDDILQIGNCRQEHNRLGFGYQLAFVRLLNRFPTQIPFEVTNDILAYVSIQLNIPSKKISAYNQRQPTISDHQETIRRYLSLIRFAEVDQAQLTTFLFEEACRSETTRAILAKTKQFLAEQSILQPSDDTLQRLIVSSREQAKEHIYQRIAGLLEKSSIGKLESLVSTEDNRISPFQMLKQPPGRPSPGAMLKLILRLETILSFCVTDIDLSWLNNNLQRALMRYAKQCTATRLRKLEPNRRHAVLVCFLWQSYSNNIDYMVDMYDKLINKVYKHAQVDVDDHHKKHRKQIRESLFTFKGLASLILDDGVDDVCLRQELFKKIDKKDLSEQIEMVDVWLTGKYSHVFNLVTQRFSYIRQFSPALVNHLHIIAEDSGNSDLPKAIDLLKQLNEHNKRKLPEDSPIGFIPKKLRPLVQVNGIIDKAGWECALLTAVRDEIKAGNISVKMSKHFGHFDNFFISSDQWAKTRETFFKRAGFPNQPSAVPGFLNEFLKNSFDRFMNMMPENAFAKIDEHGWRLSSDHSEKPDEKTEKGIDILNRWLSENMRVVKLPELLIEIDNELKITRQFLPTARKNAPNPEDICAVIATVMAHGCNIGPYTMAQLTGINYGRIKHISDWMISEEGLRATLATVVNAISNLDITQAWGEGKTSSSDGQRFGLNRKVLQQTYSVKFRDFAIEFYSFVADNYAPFYSIPIECTDRDAPYILDGLLYNESDLPLEEHYTDTHGYTENNFAAFAMLGRRFAPRIRGLHKQRIYKIDTEKDYQALTPLVGRADRTIHMNWIVDQWDRMGHFYASLECGHVTASTAMKRLNGFTGKNHFFRANRELGRIFKTDHILQYMSNQALRSRTRKGLLKNEQLHALARDLNYGKRGRISNRDIQEQQNSCSCLTIILACIVYWQAKEINRVILECDPIGNGIDIQLIEHISPITWDNVILYGEYVIDEKLIQL